MWWLVWLLHRLPNIIKCPLNSRFGSAAVRLQFRREQFGFYKWIVCRWIIIFVPQMPFLQNDACVNKVNSHATVHPRDCNCPLKKEEKKQYSLFYLFAGLCNNRKDDISVFYFGSFHKIVSLTLVMEIITTATLFWSNWSIKIPLDTYTYTDTHRWLVHMLPFHSGWVGPIKKILQNFKMRLFIAALYLQTSLQL